MEYGNSNIRVKVEHEVCDAHKVTVVNLSTRDNI